MRGWSHGTHKNIYYGVAYNGHGVVLGQTAGRMIAELIAGEKSDLHNLFILNHKIPYAGPTTMRLPGMRMYKWLLMRSSGKTTH